MSEVAAKAKRADYGIDAPGVVRMLGVGGAAALIFAAVALGAGWGRGARMVGGVGVVWLFFAGWFVWDGKVGKVRMRERRLDLVPWRGDEMVLDVGCGRGLLLVGAAKRLTGGGGKAVGVDVWRAEDLSGNGPEGARENARIEGVAERVEVRDGDARRLPFGDGTFDVVVSEAVLHNISNAAGRDAAVREIARVLKPGGRVVVGDVRHTGRYVRVLRESGVEDVRRTPESVASLIFVVMSLGFVYPAVVTGRKGAYAEC